MSSNHFNDQWLIRDENGQVKGPFPTEIIQKMIIDGKLTGQEKIAQHPHGLWRALEKQEEFFEAILESLENPIDRDEKMAQKMDAETVVINSNQTPPQSKKEPQLPSIAEDIKKLVSEERANPTADKVSAALMGLPAKKPTPHKDLAASGQKATDSLIEARDKQVTIELHKIEVIKSLQSQKFIPFVVLVIILFAGAFYYLNNQNENQVGWILISPTKPADAPVVTEEASLKSFKKALLLIKNGNLEDIRDSQKFLVASLVGNINDLPKLSTLCIVYDLIWPYTKQTSQDLKAVTQATQLIRSLNPISNYSDTCQAVALNVSGKPREARGLVEKSLDQRIDADTILLGLLYNFKAQLLEDQQSYLDAEAYYNEAASTIQDWRWARFSQARMLMKQEKYLEAKNIFEAILNPRNDSKAGHFKAAHFGLAISVLKMQSGTEKAISEFEKGYVIESKIPKAFHLEALLEYAKILMTKTDNKKALEVAQAGLKISPSHRGLKEIIVSLGGEEVSNNASSELIALGDQYAKVGQHLEAQAQYKAAFEFEPTNGNIALKAAKSLWAINQSRDALLWVDKAIKSDKKLIAAYTLKADYLSQKFNFSEALKVLTDANRVNNQSFDVFKTQALVEYRKNNLESAVAYSQKALKIYDADVETLTLLANANISLFLNYPTRTKEDEARKQKFKDDAEKYSNKAVDLEPGSPESQITYSKYLFAAKGALVSENNLKKLIETFPYTTEYKIALAEFYDSQEKYRTSSEIYLRIVQSEPKNKKALMGLAHAYRFLNEPNLAQKYYMSVAVLDPNDVEPVFATASLELENASGNTRDVTIQSALKKFNTIREINPNYPLISFNIAKCYYEFGQFDQAITYINEEKKKNPGIADPYILAAQVYESKGQFKECSSEYSQSIKIRPNSTDLYVKAASCYMKSEAFDIAEDMLNIAKEKENGYAPIYRELGYLLEFRGNKTEALKKYQLYISLSPNAPDRAVIERKIIQLGGSL